MLTTNVDKILEILKEKKSAPLTVIAAALGTNAETVMKTAEYLEEEGLLKIEYKFMKPFLTILEKQAEKKEEHKEETIESTKNILDTEFDAPKPQEENKDYASLGQEEIAGAEFPKEITELGNDEEEKEKKPEPQIVVINQGGGGQGGPSQAPENEEQETEGNELPAYEDVEGEAAEGSSVGIGTGGKDISQSEIDEMINKANEMIDFGEISTINEFYEQIYDKIENNDSLAPESKEELQGRLARLFSRIKRLYLSESLDS